MKNNDFYSNVMLSSFLPVSLGSDVGFSKYLNEINKIPSLTSEQEYMLAKSYCNYKDINSAHKLVTSHLKLVVKIAVSYKGYGLPMVELVSEGNIGLMQAVKKFDPERGFRLSTYAIWWIKAAIQEYVLKSWSLVKIGTTAAQKKLFFNLGKIKRRINALEARNLNNSDYKNVAKELDVSEADVAEMDVRMKQDYSLDTPISSDDTDSVSFMDVLQSQQESQEISLANTQEHNYKQKLLYKAIDSLNDREKHIIQERKLKDNPATLENLSNYYKISKERVRQIEEKALKKMSEMIKNSNN